MQQQRKQHGVKHEGNAPGFLGASRTRKKQTLYDPHFHFPCKFGVVIILTGEKYLKKPRRKVFPGLPGGVFPITRPDLS
jgi:hypothetical protein